jgi:hypothetical protein
MSLLKSSATRLTSATQIEEIISRIPAANSVLVAPRPPRPKLYFAFTCFLCYFYDTL